MPRSYAVSFCIFECDGSSHRWLYTHRGGQWTEYYSEEALVLQRRFFARFLKSEQNSVPEVPRAQRGS